MSALAPFSSAIGVAIISAIGLDALTSRHIIRSRDPSPADDRRGATRTIGVIAGIVPRGRVRTSAIALAATVLATWLAGPVIFLALVAAVAGVVRAVPIFRRRQAQQQAVRAVPDALDLVVVLLQAGAAPRQTFRELARCGPPATRAGFNAVCLQLERGHPFDEAIGALRIELGDPITPFVEIISASERYGLPTAHLVHQLSTETRALRRRHDEAAARSLPVKLSFPLVMCTLPSFVLLAIAPAVLAALSSLGGNAW